MALRPAAMISRRARYSATITSTSGSAWRSAASAPTMANEVGFEVAWLWMFSTARMIGAGPSR